MWPLTSTSEHGEPDGDADEAMLGLFDVEFVCDTVVVPVLVVACEAVSLADWLQDGVRDCVETRLCVADCVGEAVEDGAEL